MHFPHSMRTLIFAIFIGAFGIIMPDISALSQSSDGQIETKSEIIKQSKNPDLPTSTEDILGRLRGTLHSANQALTRQGNRDADLAVLSDQASNVRIEALQLEGKLTPLLQQVDEQLVELGAKPADGEPPESDEIQSKRKELEENYSRLDGEIKAMRLVAVGALQVERQIITDRRVKFVREISSRSHGMFDSGLWQKFYSGFEGFVKRFGLLIGDSFSVMQGHFAKSAVLPLIIAIGLALIFAITYIVQRGLNRLERRIRSSAETVKDSRNSVIRLAGLFLVEKGLLPLLPILAIYYLFNGLNLFTPRLSLFLFDSVLLIAGIILSLALARVFLSPKIPEDRIVQLSDTAAHSVYLALIAIITIVATIRMLVLVAIASVSPFEVVVGLNALLALTVFIGAISILIIVARDQPEDPVVNTKDPNLVRWGYLNPIIWLSSIIGLSGLFAGYIAFGEFIAWQIIIAGFIFAALWIGLEVFNQYREQFLHRQSGNWRKVSRATGFSKQTILQSGVFIFGIARLSIIVITAIVLLIPWGYRTGDWVQLVSGLFFGFKIGGLTISISSIVLAVILFGVGYFVTRAIQNWLRGQFLPTTSLDLGLRNSIATIFGYIGIVLAALLGITAAGLNLSNLAIVAGALSVGIGFGLQSIVNNFVSGLILLAERPIKSGDWVITSGGQGTVKKTSVRSTEIETFDGATVIVPNSILITEAVTNWTHHDKIGRVIVPIGVGYDSDPDQVHELLLSCIDGIEGILEDPAPRVYFIDFGADALMFELRAYLKDINSSLSVKSGLRFAMLRKLRAAGIEIPYPQRDVHVKSMPQNLPIAKAATSPGKNSRAKTKPITPRRRKAVRKDNEEADD